MRRLNETTDEHLDEFIATSSILLGLQIGSALIFAYNGYKRYKQLKKDVYRREGNAELPPKVLLKFVNDLYKDSIKRAKKPDHKKHLQQWKSNMDQKIKDGEIKSIADFEDENKSFNSLSSSIMRKLFDSEDYSGYVTEKIINPTRLKRLAKVKAGRQFKPKVNKKLSKFGNIKKSGAALTVLMTAIGSLASLGEVKYQKKKYGDLTISKSTLKSSLKDIKNEAIKKAENDLQKEIIENWYKNKLNSIEKGKIKNITDLVSGNDWVLKK